MRDISKGSQKPSSNLSMFGRTSVPAKRINTAFAKWLIFYIKMANGTQNYPESLLFWKANILEYQISGKIYSTNTGTD